jgi:hypothetical protein
MIMLLSPPLKAIDVAAILVLNISAMLLQSRAFLLPSLLGSEAFLVGSDQPVVLLVQPSLALLKALPLLQCSTDVGLHALDLALNVALDCVEFARDSILIVTFRFPFRFLGCSFMCIVLRYATQLLGLNHKLSSSIIGLADVLRELKNALALALITTSSISKTVTECVDLLLDSGNGCFVVLLVPLQAITLFLELLFGCRNRVFQGRCWRRRSQSLMSWRRSDGS